MQGLKNRDRLLTADAQLLTALPVGCDLQMREQLSYIMKQVSGSKQCVKVLLAQFIYGLVNADA